MTWLTLKVKSCDVEAWSPRQKKYFEVGSCSNLGDAQHRRLKSVSKGEDVKQNISAHTLNRSSLWLPPKNADTRISWNTNLQEEWDLLRFATRRILQPYTHGAVQEKLCT